jgi:hypothetical protein
MTAIEGFKKFRILGSDLSKLKAACVQDKP